MGDSTFITRVRLQNYKSIGRCDVSLGALTFLVGPNGAGKSNFVDALRFVAEALRTTLELALRDRGGIGEVRRRSAGHPNHFALGLDFALGDRIGTYFFRIGAKPRGAWEVQEESCHIAPTRLADYHFSAHFRVESGNVRECSASTYPPAAPDRLYLVNAAGLPEFRPLYDALSSMGFYNLNPDKIKELQSPGPGNILARDGSNITSVYENLSRDNGLASDRVIDYLSQVVPGVRGVDVKMLGPKQTLEFRQVVAGSKDPWRFLAANMSDGTLRAFGVLVALFQTANGKGAIRLVALEEPESALHPGAAGVLLDSLTEVCQRTQVLVTSHSPDVLDEPNIFGDIIAVQGDSGSTELAPLDDAARSALKDRLYTAGELMRAGQLKPDSAYLERVRQGHLFDGDSLD
jgi:predicted ATPase